MSSAQIPAVLAIAGSDPSGGAGLQADLKTFAAFRCHGMAVVTAATAQNTLGVRAVHALPPEFVAAQIDALFEDGAIGAVKIGMLARPSIAEAVAAALRRGRATNIVLDPVLAATQGADVSQAGLAAAIREHLLPLAALVTPNLAEAATLTGTPLATELSQMTAQARALVALGAGAALVKGGHCAGAPNDVLVYGGVAQVFEGARIATRNTHGTGCALSAAIAAGLARGADIPAATAAAKDWLERALAAGADVSFGQGAGPPLHFWDYWR